METVMSGPSVAAPARTRPIAGVVNTRSPHGVGETDPQWLAERYGPAADVAAPLAAAGAPAGRVAAHTGEK